ncbi:MAG: hypothetical protein AB1736_03770 [Chloroflexota bacterium]
MSASFRPDFNVELSSRALGPNVPQRIGRLLWAPMLVMAVMAFPLGLAIGIARANLVATGGDAAMIAALGHLGPAAMFVGFAAVFAAISFAIARILGVLRAGGGQVQEAAGRRVQTLRMPPTAWAFIGLMAMAMMVILAGVAGNVVVGASIAGGSTDLLAQSDGWAIWFEGVRRIGVALYLVAIALGLATIIEALRFQAIRLRELPAESAD